MFDGAVNVIDYVMEDYMVLANYVQGFDGGTVDASNSPLSDKYSGFTVNYGTRNGSGRITLSSKAQISEVTSSEQNSVPDTRLPDETSAASGGCSSTMYALWLMPLLAIPVVLKRKD